MSWIFARKNHNVRCVFGNSFVQVVVVVVEFLKTSLLMTGHISFS